MKTKHISRISQKFGTDHNETAVNLRKAATQQDPVLLRKKIDGLYESCFRCHAANAPR